MVTLFLAALFACDATPDAGPPPVVPWDVYPSALDVEEARVGVVERVEVTFANTGAEWLSITSIEGSPGVASTSGAANLRIAPGDTLRVEVDVSPPALGAFEGELRLNVAGPAGDALGTASVPVAAEGVGPAAGMSPDHADLGELGMQCWASTPLVVRNDGNLDLHVTALSFDDAQGFVVNLPPESAPPWTLGPGTSTSVNIDFTPIHEGEVVATLTLRSDDALNPAVQQPFHVTVAEGHQASESWEVSTPEVVTGLFAVNEVVNGVYAARFEAALPGFFATLLAAGQPFRIAFVHTIGGTVEGPVRYVDQTFTAPQATAAALAMVAGASGDNDYLLSALDLGIEENRAWLLEDDAEAAWSASKLNLVGINSDQEQSSGNATFYVNHYLAEKADPGDIAVHGLGGDDPAGCPGAEPFTPFAEAARATGGLFQSICDEDWTTNFVTLAHGFLDGGQTAFRLSEVPVAGSLSVFVDGEAQVSGWTWENSANVVYFHEGQEPAPGSTVRADYAVSSACPG